MVNSKIKNEIEKYADWSKALVVANPEQRERVSAALREVKTKRKEIVEFFADSKEKAHSAWKAIVANEKSFTDKIDAFEKAAKPALMSYDEKIEAARLEEQTRLQKIEDEKAARERAKLEAAAKKARGDKKEELLDKAAMVVSHTVTLPDAPKGEGESVKLIWKYKITNVDLIPREYMEPNEKMLGDLARASKGRIIVPGVEIYSEKSMAVSVEKE